jgi:RNA polymerase sigma factor (sigma-70 family)
MMPDAFSRSVTQWIEDLKKGEDDAARKLWDRYFYQLVDLARRKLGGADRRVSDEEDLALSAFHALSTGAAAGRFDKLETRDDLWSLLIAITSKKAVSRIRRQTAQKRGGGIVRGNSVFGTADRAGEAGFERVIGTQPTPEFIALMDEEHHRLLDMLRDDVQRDIVRHRLAGYSNEEIAKLVGISLRSVERKLMVVRDIWSTELQR